MNIQPEAVTQPPNYVVRIVAFLQNPWFPEGTNQRHIDKYTTDQDFHRRVLAMSMTGKKLQNAFGGMYRRIWWDNASPIPCAESSGCQNPDFEHIRHVIREQRPELILTFGRVAQDAILHIKSVDQMVLNCWHPNARGKTQQELSDFAESVRKTVQRLGEQKNAR